MSTSEQIATRRREPRHKASWSKQVTRWAVVFFAVAVIVDAVVGERGLMAMLRARSQYDADTASLDRQRADNEKLRDQIRRLKDDPAAIEELARGELGLMRAGEKLFIIKDLTPAGQ